MSNPFLRRATEYIRSDSAFLAIVTPEPLTTFVGNHPKKSALFDLPVRVVGSPGSGKTMMASLVEYRLVEAVLRDQSSANNRELAAALTRSGFIEEDRPAIAAVRLPMEAEYRDYWELPYDDAIKTKLALSLIQARAILGLVRNLTANKLRSLDNITFVLKDGAAASLESIGGPDADAIVRRAIEVERAVYGVGASLLPPKLDDIPSGAREPYQPFEIIERIQISWLGETIALKPLVILDDVHALHPDQFDRLFRYLARREVRVARWMMMRMDALSPRAVFRSRGEEPLPGLKQERDYIDIFMQTDSDRDADRKRFRRMASAMADRYLPFVRPLRERNFTEFATLLSGSVPALTDARREELRAEIDKDQRALGIATERRAQIETLVAAYAKGAKSYDVEADVQLAMVRVLMHRYVNRIGRPSLFGAEANPDPKKPLKADSDVAEAARLYLHDKFGRAFHYGLATLCDASNENAEVFLQLAGALVERMETRAVRNQDPALTPAQQQSALEEKGRMIVDQWSFPYSRSVRALIDVMAEECRKMSLTDHARLGAGANAVGIPESDMEVLLAGGTQLAEALKYAIAYGALVAVRAYGQGSKDWCLLELPGVVCMRSGLTLRRGGFLEWKVDRLAEIVGHT